MLSCRSCRRPSRSTILERVDSPKPLPARSSVSRRASARRRRRGRARTAQGRGSRRLCDERRAALGEGGRAAAARARERVRGEDRGARGDRVRRGGRAGLHQPAARRLGSSSTRSRRWGGVRRRLGRPGRARPGRDGLREPDRPDRRLARPKRRVRRLRGAAAGRSPAHEVAREYYYNDAGAQMERFRASIDALRGRRAGPRGRLPRRLRRGARPGGRRPGAARCSRRSSRRWSASASTSTAGLLQSELEQRLAELLPRLDTYEQDGALWARSSAYGDEQDWVLVRSADRGGTPTYRAADVAYLVDKLDRGFDRAIYVLGADHHATASGTRRSRACSATTPTASRCCCTSSCT